MAQDNPREKLWELIKDIRFAMITHQHEHGSLHAAPMTTANKEGMNEDKNLYFLLGRDSDLSRCLSTSSAINVSYADPNKDSYVSVSATGSISDDLALKEQLFSPMAKAWFPDGPSDPNLQILVARVDFAEYWDVKENKLVQLFKMAKSAVTGERPDGMGEHREIKL